MPRLPGISCAQAIRAFEKAGFRIIRQSGHVVMARKKRRVILPRHNPIHAVTMGVIVRGSGLTIEEFKELLK